MVLLKDAPKTIREERGVGGIMAIPGLRGSQVVKIIQQRKQASHGQDTSSGDVQILEIVVGGRKDQLVTVSHAGVRNCSYVRVKKRRRGGGEG